MSFKPCCLATATCTMPHKDPKRACQVILDNLPEAPHLPRLPNRSWKEAILFSLEGMPCVVVDEEKQRYYFDTSDPSKVGAELTEFYERYLAQDLEYFALSPEYAPGVHTMLEMLRQNPLPQLKLIVFGTTGPVSFGIRAVDEKGKPIFYNEALRDAVTKTLAMKARWLEMKVHEAAPGIPTMANLGEPYLGVYSSAFAAIRREDIITCINEWVEATSGITCVHCCGNIDWPILMETKLDVINFDASQHSENIALYREDLKRFLERGGMFAWGIVPNTDKSIANATVDSLVEAFDTSLQAVTKWGTDKLSLLESSFITPICTTAPMSIELAEKTYRMTKGLAKAMRSRYFN